MTTPLQNTPEWVAWRRGGIGASELPAIIGEDSFRSEYELALEKRGEGEPQRLNSAMAWGHRVQRIALDVYAEMTGYRVRNVNTTMVSKRHPHVYASLDGRVVGERRGVEVKLTSRWEEPPRKVVVQCQAQMGVASLDVVDVVRVGMYGEPAIYPIERDDTLIRELLDLGEAWYQRYVLGDELPPVDGSRGASRHLDRIEGPPEMEADDDQAVLAARLQAVKRTVKASEAEHDELVNRLKDSMHGSYALIGHGFRVAWKPSKGRTSTDWKGVAARLGLDAAPDALTSAVEEYTTTGEGARPFRVTFDTEGEG